MIQLPQRLSPLHDALEPLHPHWVVIEGMPTATAFGDPAAENRLAETAALCDVSALPRLTLKGRAAEGFLAEQGLAAPGEIGQCLPLPGDGLIARTGGSEFFLEEGVRRGILAGLMQALEPSREGVYRVLRQDASLLLSGSRAGRVLRQTCGVDFRQADSRLVMTRIAGVSCAVLPRNLNSFSVFQLWLDGSYGLYLWETLHAILDELDGGVVGTACFFPELVSDKQDT